MLREKIYELKNWKLAVHTTWNPGAENVMRIHLVPPRFLSGKIVPSVVILNGQEIVPVSEAWAILLTEFIRRINEYENHAIEEKEVQQVLKETFGAVRKIYPKTDPEVFHRDLSVMLDTFEDVIAGKIPQMENKSWGICTVYAGTTPDGSYGFCHDTRRKMALQSKMHTLLCGRTTAVRRTGA